MEMDDKALDEVIQKDMDDKDKDEFKNLAPGELEQKRKFARSMLAMGAATKKPKTN